MTEGIVPAEVRRERILRHVRDRDFARVTDLSDLFGISEVTVRSDLDLLADAGTLRRVRGGAVATATPIRERSFEESLDAFPEQRRSIGRAAAATVASGDTVLIDVGTTAAALAAALVDRQDLHDVVAVTSGVNIALTLEPAIPRFTVIVTGGTLRPQQHSLVDPLADCILDGLRATVAFLGCNGVHTEAGITNANIPETAVKRRMLRAAGRRVVLADSSKLGQVSIAHMCDLGDVDLIATDAGADAVLIEELRAAGVGVEVAA